MPLIVRIVSVIGILVGGVALAVSVTWLTSERVWSASEPLTPAAAFDNGPLGLEFAPLKYVLVMHDLSRDAFRRAPGDERPWTKAYGFLARPNAPLDPICADNAAEALPVGLSITNFLPGNNAPSPLAFVGLSCSACHSAQLVRGENRSAPIVGAGSFSLDLIAWSDAFANAVLDPALNEGRILDAYDARCPRAGVWDQYIGRFVDQTVIGLWLSRLRNQLRANASKYDLAHSGTELLDATVMPAGPSRTRPFRSVVRNVLNFPGEGNAALSKVPVAFDQDQKLRPWSQFDGSIHRPLMRSLIAAFTSGSTLAALASPAVEQSIRAAAEYTLTLGTAPKMPSFFEAFPDQARPSAERLELGREVYMARCNGCHGHRPAEGAPWSLEGAGLAGELTPVEPRKNNHTALDSARLFFRYAEFLPVAIATTFPGGPKAQKAQEQVLAARERDARAAGRFAEADMWKEANAQLILHGRRYPKGHPMTIWDDARMPQPEGVDGRFTNAQLDRLVATELRANRGYINNPIPYPYLRAPYLHNGSVPTMRQLIGLDPRPERFCRGDNPYDPAAMGLSASSWEKLSDCPPDLAFAFDAREPGNGNRGHYYPWRPEEASAHRAELEALLDFLRTQ